MRITDLFGRGRPLVSFEFFPPATPAGETALVQTVEALRPLGPAFVTVTRTGAKPAEAPIDLAARIAALGFVSAAHMTSITSTAADVERLLDLAVARGIENLVALRGDIPPGGAPAGDFRYGVDLVRFIRRRGHPFCLLGGGYPEGHVDCRDRDRDVAHLKAKVDAGLDVVVTQLFYDNADYFGFVQRARRVGIRVPIVPGIMPITNFPQIRRIAGLCGATIPAALEADLAAAGDDEAKAFAVGVAHATAQCEDLLRRGAPGIHFYTLNKSPATRRIFEHLQQKRLLAPAPRS